MFACGRVSGRGTSKRPVLLEWRSSNAFIIFVVVFAVFTDIFLYGLIVPVTPTALHEKAGLHEGDEQKWTSILLGLYSGALLALSPPAGYLADRIQSRRWPLILGLFALGASTALLCIGTHIALWIAGRLFQGASAAVVWTVGCALLVDTVDKDALGQALGYIGMGMTIGALGGPLLGGVIYEKAGYYAVYAVAFALIALDIVFRIVMIEKKDAMRWLELEPEPKRLHPCISNETERKPSPLVDTTSSGAGVLLSPDTESQTNRPDISKATLNQTDTSSAVNEKKKKCRQQQHSALYTLLASDRIIVTIWAYFIISLILTSLDSVLPLFVKDTFHWEQSAQGLIFIPLTIPHIIDPVVGYINDRYESARRYLASGALFAAVPVLVLFRLVRDNSMHDKILLCALLALLGLCLATMMAPVLVEASYVVKEKEEQNPEAFGKGGAMALAYGVLNSAFAAGGLVGPFLAGFIRESAGWGTMAWAMALVTGVSGVPVLLFLGGFVFRRREIQVQAQPRLAGSLTVDC